MRRALGWVGNWAGSHTFHFLFFAVCFSILTTFKIDPDFGWHLRYGQVFLETGKKLAFDEFSWTMSSFGWANSYLVYDVIVAYLFGFVGHFGLAIIFGTIASIAYVILIKKPLNLSKTLIVLLGVAIATVNVGVRPHTISLLFFSVMLVILDRGYFKAKHFWIWFLLFAFWANIHRAFAIGILVLVVHLAIKFIVSKKTKVKVFALDIIIVILASALGTLATPFIFGTWKSGVLFDLLSRDNLSSIAEWQPIAIYTPINLILGLSGVIFGTYFYRNFRKIDPAWFLPAAMLFMLSFVAVLFAFFWSVIFVFVVIGNFDFKYIWKLEKWPKIGLGVILCLLVISLFLNFAAGAVESADINRRLVLDKYPLGALEFMDRSKLTDGVFNEYMWGGFMIWKYPHIKVFVDGRMASWSNGGHSILADYMRVVKEDCTTLETYMIKVAFISKSFSYKCFSNWKMAYEDKISKVLVNPDFK